MTEPNVPGLGGIKPLKEIMKQIEENYEDVRRLNRMMARERWDTFCAYKDQGFSKEEALELIKASIK